MTRQLLVRKGSDGRGQRPPSRTGRLLRPAGPGNPLCRMTLNMTTYSVETTSPYRVHVGFEPPFVA